MLIFLGKLTYPPYATNELFAIIFSNNIQQGEKVVVVHQWTKDAAGQAKANSFAQGSVDKAVVKATGEKEVEIFYADREETYYWYKGTQSGSKLTLSMYNKTGEEVVKRIELLANYY